jgi:IS30 family transposase
MSYKQLIEGQRYQISAYLSENLSFREIARKMGLNHSTISREVRRNSMSSRDYIPQKAHALALKRRKESAKSKLCELTVMFVEYCLSHKWSPEQIAGVGRLVGYKVSHTYPTMYDAVFLSGVHRKATSL